MSHRKLTEKERADRRQAHRDRIERAARALLSSDGWSRWVQVRSTNGLARYSFNNQLLIALQRPDASFVAGFRAWLSLGYCVRKGEKAIWICAPMSVKERDAGSGEETGERRTFFRAVPVFDRGQVEPGEDPTPLEPPREPIEGDSHAHLLEPLQDLARELGYTVHHRSLGDIGADGWCDAENHEIVVNEQLAANAQVRVLIHELAHALGIGYREYGRDRAEVLVDTITYIVCGAVGLDVSGETIPYLAGWGEEGALDAISAYAQTIDEIARRIERSLCAEESPRQAQMR